MIFPYVPPAGLSGAARDWIARALRIQQTRGAAAVITHDLPFAQRHAGQVVTLAQGKVSNIREYRA
jgi:ABC-type sulfate/molybdate transport systems ATPase subunit